MASKLDAGGLVKSSWEYLSKNVAKLWIVALFLSLPSMLSALSNHSHDAVRQNIDSFSNLSSYTETVFGVSVATLGIFVFLFLMLSIIYSLVVYGGSLKLMLGSLRGDDVQFKLGYIFRTGTKYLGKFAWLGILGGAIIFAGLLLLVIPGLIAIFLLSLSAQFLLDKDLTAGEALSASYKLVKNNVSNVLSVYFLLILVSIGISIVTNIFLGVDIWLIRVLNAAIEGFVGLFGLIVTTKLYLALTDGKST